MSIRNLLIVILCLFSSYLTYAQSNYTLINDAIALPGCHCYQLTADQGNQGGGVYQNNTINLNNSFDYTFNVYLGSNGNSGADGMTFILTPNITAIGAQGGGLGYSGLAGNSLAVEYDTYQNGWDPPYNHIALEYNGQVEHPTGTIMGPYPALPGNANMDNGVWHTTEIVWNVNTHTYTVYFDGNLIFSYSGNIITNYFAGNPVVNWGWAGSTGGSENTQQFCVLSTSNWTAGTNYQTCNLTVQFTDISTTNVDSIQSWKWNFGDPASGANNTSSLQDPTHTFSSSGTYTVSLIITDISGCPDTFVHAVTINPPITLTPTLTDPPCNGGTNGDITLATTGGFGSSAGYGGYQYTWSNNSTDVSSSDIGLTAGTYNVTCTDGVCTTTASYNLTQPTALTATTSSTAAPCGSTGTATITISGGTPPYQNVTWDGIAGSPGPNTFTSSGLPVGTVVANFKDANGCSAILEYTQNIIQLPCGYTESTSSTNVTCFGGSNGSVSLSVTGQTGTVTVTWDNSSGTQVGTGYTVTNLPAGVYTYHYSDTKPTTLTGTVTVTQPGGAMTVSLSTVNTTCSYLNNGSAVASVTANGTAPYHYAWSAAGQANSPTATGLSPGPITVTVTDANGCTGTATGTVSGQTAIGLVISTTPDSCYQTLTGTISVVASGGTPAYTYQWSSGPTAVGTTVYSLGQGSYTVTVTDHNSCTATASGTISQPPQLTATMTDSNIACFGGASGTATVTAGGGNGGYTYSWSPTAFTTAGITGLAPNTYYVTVTDSKLCKVVDSAVITQPASAFTVTVDSTNVSCYNVPNGTITLVLSGGSTPYGTVNWSGGATGTSRTGLAAGTYTYTVSDAHLCQVTGSVTLTQPASSFLITPDVTSEVKCFGASTGSVTLVPSGGTAPYGIAGWLDLYIGDTRNNLPAGTYFWGDTDHNGCIDTGFVVITQPASGFTVTPTITEVLCHGNSTGSIVLAESGGTTPYPTVTWRDGGATGTTRNNLPAGSYSYIATDANGCTDSATLTITQPASGFTVTPTITEVLCHGNSTGSIILAESGGTTPYPTVTWRDGGATGTTRNNLPAGTYSYIATDANGCTDSATLTITQPASGFTVTPTVTEVKCFGNNTGSIVLAESGGTTPYPTVTWRDGGATGTTRNNLPAGSYSYIATDANGCTDSATLTITQPAVAFTVTPTITEVLCHGNSTGSIVLVESGGTTPYPTVTWRDGGATGTTRNNLPAGSYSYIATDANGCTDSATLTITQPASGFTVTPTITEVLCHGNSTGSIVLAESGGTTPYPTVTWRDGGATGTTRNNLPAGTYSYIATDANGCTDSATLTITQPASGFTVTPTVTEVKCFGGSTGSIVLAESGGTTPYPTVTWRDGGATGTTRNNLPAGSYSYIATDANGCTDSATLTITQPASGFTVTPTITEVLCHGNSTGSIVLAESGGTTPYPTVTWRDGGATGTTRNNLPAGSYSYIATDANGCTDSATLTITQPISAFTVTPTVTNVLCFGNSTGSIVLAESGGTTPYPIVAWRDGGATGTTRNNLPAGTYSYIAMDANGCTDSATLTITQPVSAFTVTPTVTNVVCYSNSTGSIVLSESGGTTPYPTVTWRDGGATGTTRNNLPAGTYSYIATDANGCTDSATLTITQPANGLTVTPTITEVLCFGNNTGAIDLSLSGGVTPYSTITWRNSGVTGPSRTNLDAGTYSYIVSDASGCTDSATLAVTQPVSAFTVTPTVTNVSCFGNSTGSITLTESGGTTPYPTVTWRDGGATGTSRTNLAAGSYSYIATDANGCTDSATLTITQPASAFVVTPTQVNVLCYGESTGSITLTPSGGTTPYAIAEWLDGFVGDVRNNLPAATYYYADSDNNGCLVTGQVIITQPTSPFTVTPTVTPVTCFGGTNGSIILAESGGTTAYPTVTWRDGGATGTSRTNLSAGNYSYIATDANGCTDSATLNVAQPTAIVPVLGPITEITCNGSNNGTVVVTASGGTGTLAFELDGSGNFQSTGAFTGLTAGQHVVTVQDANGCQQSITFNITQPNPLTLTVASTINDSCAGLCDGSVIVTASGGTQPYEYSIDQVNYFASDTFTGLCANPSYTISVQDANQCGNNTTAAITQPTAVTVALGSTTPPTCNNGSNASFTVSASGGTGAGYTYSINGTSGPFQASGTFTGLTPGTYNVLAEDANGCQGNLSVTVANTPPSSSYTTVDAPVSCFGGSNGSVTVIMTGTATPYSFTWSNGATTQNLTNLPAGSDTLWVTDVNGCVVYSTDSVNTITQPAQISAVNNPIVNVTCFGDSNGCITVTPGGGVSPFTNSWSNGATTANPCGFKAGTYTDTLTDANGCQYIDAGIVVTQPNQITIALDSVTLVSCPGDSNGAIQITASNGTPGYTYSWSPGGGTGDPLTGVPVGSYSVTVTDANHCTATDSATVGVNNPLSYNATLNNVLCPPLQNGSISLTVSGGAPGYQYMWSNGATTSSITNLNVGIDSVTVTDSRGCTFDTGFVIINDSAFAISLQDTASINQGDEELIGVQVTKDNGAGTVSYSWTPPTGLSCSDCQAPEVAPFTTTQYVVTATTDLGCVATAQILVTVTPQHQLYVPNAFTPNGDGINDFWEAFGFKTAWTFCSVSVFDRWGEKVFESDDIDFKWDGKYRGNYVEPGEFVYELKVVFVDGYATENKGTITVIR